MIETGISYTARCDLCGETPIDQGSEYLGWGEQDHAEDEASDNDWHIEGGNHICLTCQDEMPPYDYGDEQAKVCAEHGHEMVGVSFHQAPYRAACERCGITDKGLAKQLAEVPQ